MIILSVQFMFGVRVFIHNAYKNEFLSVCIIMGFSDVLIGTSVWTKSISIDE